MARLVSERDAAPTVVAMRVLAHELHAQAKFREAKRLMTLADAVAALAADTKQTSRRRRYGRGACGRPLKGHA